MFKQFYDDWKKEMTETVRKMILKLEDQYDKFWSELMSDLQKKKLSTEEDIRTLGISKAEKEKEVNDFSEEVIELSKTIKREKETILNLENRKKILLNEVLDAKESVQGIAKREADVEKKEKELKDRDLEIKAKSIALDEKRKRIKRIMDKLES